MFSFRFRARTRTRRLLSFLLWIALLLAMLGPASGVSEANEKSAPNKSTERIFTTPSPSPVGSSPTPTVMPTATPIPTATPRVIEIGASPSDEAGFGTDAGEWEAKSVPLTLSMPEGALTETVKIQLSIPELDESEREEYLGAFELGVSNDQGSIDPTLVQSMTLTIDISDYLDDEDETGQRRPPRSGTPSFFRWSRATRRWLRLNSTFNWNNGRLQARTRRMAGRMAFGFAADVGSYGAQLSPTINGFTSDQFNGNSNVNYPLILPPAPGSMGFALALGYSSENANSIFGMNKRDYNPNLKRYTHQASSIGWGWNLIGLGRITRNLSDKRIHLTFPGGRVELKKNDQGEWQSKPQSFFKIEANDSDPKKANLWHVWTPDGTRYTFGGDWNTGVAYNIETQSGCPRNKKRLREAHLTEIRDIHGNRITISYAQEKSLFSDGCVGFNYDYVHAIRPTEIKYMAQSETLDSARIEFVYVSDREDTHIQNHDNSSVQTLWSNQRLEQILVQVRNSSSGYATTRHYKLTQSYDRFGDDDDDDDRESIMRLDGYQQFGHDGGVLPAHHFAYTYLRSRFKNSTVLAWADNGQGGRVEYQYERHRFRITGCSRNGTWNENSFAKTYRFSVKEMTIHDGLGNQSKIQYNSSSPLARGEGYYSHACAQNFEFAGYGQVVREVSDAQGVYSKVETNFHQENNSQELNARTGLVYLQRTLDPTDDRELQRVETTWDQSHERGTAWVRKAQQTSTTEGISQKTEYHYVPAHQGGQQYGHVTHVKQYLDGGDTLYRTKETTYAVTDQGDTPDTITYIVNKPIRQTLWAPDVGQSCEADSALLYDNQVYGTPPTKGLVTTVHVAQTSCSGTWSNTSYTYDAWGNRLSETNPLGKTTQTTYDTSGNPSDWPRLYTYPTTVSVPLVGTTHYHWDKVIGQVLSVRDINDVVTNYTYDEFGRFHKEWARGNGGASTTIVQYHNYDAANNQPFHLSTAKRTTLGTEPGMEIYHYTGQHTYYDGLGQEIQTRSTYINPQNENKHAVTLTEYNALGNPRVSYAPVEDERADIYRPMDWAGWNDQPKTVSEYDALGRVTFITQPDGTQVDNRYGTIVDDGRLFAWHNVIDPNHHRKHHRFDALGRMVRVIEVEGNCGDYWDEIYHCGGEYDQPWGGWVSTAYEYDVADRLVKVTDEENNETSISYDLAGRKTSMDDPDMGHWSYAYDALGNLTRQTDARQERICFFYDDLNRITGKQYRSDDNCALASGLDVTYLYDQGANGKGRRTGMQDSSGESSWQYDEKGRLIEESKTITDNGQPFIFRSQWSYDASDRVHTMTYPADEQGNLGETVTYQYSQDEYKTRAQVEGLVSDLGTYISGIQYNVYGQRTEATLGTSEPVAQRFSYYALDDLHGLGRLRRIRSKASDDTLIQRLVYTYDAVGNVQSIRNRLQNEIQNEQFSYDHLDRLLTAEAADGDNGLYSTAYSYDKIGNLTNKGGTDYTYGTQQAYCSAGALNKPHAVVSKGGWNYCYDANGNMTDKVVYIYANNYTYDSENRLTDVSANGTSIASYTYDGDGNRVKVTESSETTLYVGSLVQWRNGTLIKYYEVGGSRVAMREGDTLSFILANQLTSTTVTLDSSGNVQSELRYHPFGQTRHSDGTTPTNRRFTGQIQDQGTGLYYYNARYYNPELGRFIQADTIVPSPGNPQSLNRYSYVYNNPLKYTDPTGHYSDAEIQTHLQDTYGGNWRDYWDAWQADPYWMAILHAANDDDYLSYGSGGVAFRDKPGSFALSQGKLHQHQGQGVYTLAAVHNGMVTDIKTFPQFINYGVEVGTFGRILDFGVRVQYYQPIYDYSSGRPKFKHWLKIRGHWDTTIDWLVMDNVPAGIAYILGAETLPFGLPKVPYGPQIAGVWVGVTLIDNFTVNVGHKVTYSIIETWPPVPEMVNGELSPVPSSKLSPNPNGLNYPAPPLRLR
ncbi:MAG: RHS repeat-associated core domain-containing protein [Ardenticatenaceae bacterium]